VPRDSILTNNVEEFQLVRY